MNVFSLVGRMTTAKYSTWKAGPPARPVRTAAPLHLSQGSVVDISVVPGILAQSAGGVFPDVQSAQSVVSVGIMDLFGFRVTRSYLSDGRSFVETVSDKSDPSKSSQTRLYVLHTERMPSNLEERAFLLGSPALSIRDSVTGQDVVVQEATPALIGWPAFQLDDDAKGAVIFDRLWSPGASPQEPREAEETVFDAAGGAFRVQHQMMAYARVAGGVTEYLMAEFIETDDGAVFNASVGLDFEPSSLAVLAPA